MNAAAWRVIVFVIPLALAAYVISDSYSDAAGLDDEPAFDVADDGMIVDRQAIEPYAHVFFRSDLPVAQKCGLLALTDPLFVWSQPVPPISRPSGPLGRNSRALPRASLTTSSRAPTGDSAS